MAKIYISSTYQDLKDYREAVYKALRKNRHDIISMEDYVSENQKPLQRCLKDIASCDIYIGIFAWRYGFIPPDKNDNPEGLSITELEYRKAKEQGKHRLIFLLDEDKEWPLSFIDGTPKSGIKSLENIIRLRNYFKEEHLTSFFKNKDELATNVILAINQIRLKESALETEPKIESPLEMDFEGENKIFVGRIEYINKIIKEKLTPGSVVSIIGPGGSGKTQLAFKAIKEYVKEKIFDFVCPLYLGRVGIQLFSSFLSQIAEILGLSVEFEKENDINKRKQIIIRSLNNYKNPLIYLDNYEIISLDINKQRFDENHKPSQNSKDIENFLKNEIPRNTTILLTSRETNNHLSETPIDLEGLDKDESTDLFIKLAKPIIRDYLQPKKEIEGNKTYAKAKAVVTTKIDEGYEHFIINNKGIRSSIDKIFKITGGHPLSLEIIASNIESIYDLQNVSNKIKISDINRNNPEERLKSLESCFDYTFDKLNDNLKDLLLKLTIFNSPFLVDAPIKIFNNDNYKEKDIEQLYNRSLVIRIESDDVYGRLNLKSWLYTFHPVTKNYVIDKIRKPLTKKSGVIKSFRTKKSFHFLESILKDYEKSFYSYYLDLLSNIYNSIGKENHLDALGVFNIMSQAKDNDFERSAIFLQDIDNLQKSGRILTYLGLISKEIGFYSKALEYYNKALEIEKKMDDKVELGRVYTNIGHVYYNISDYPKALEYYNKALEIDINLDDESGLGRDYNNIGVVYRNMGNYPKALEYDNKSLEIRAEQDDKVGLGRVYTNRECLL